MNTIYSALYFREYEQGQTPENELQIYTWMDATLGELTQLIKEVNPDSRRRGTQFSFSIVTADNSHNRYYLTNIGQTENGQRRADDQIQLVHKRFHVGDYLDVAITMKKPEQTSTNTRRDRNFQQLPEENNQRRNGNDRNNSGPVRSAPRNDHRERPY